MTRKGMIIVLSGFSGAGKGTIMKNLLKAHPGQYHLSISATTRQKRQGEEDGREYFFKTREEFDQMIADNQLLEYATFNGNSYGTPRSYVEQLVNEGKDVILEIEIQGALQIKKLLVVELNGYMGDSCITICRCLKGASGRQRNRDTGCDRTAFGDLFQGVTIHEWL